MKFINESSEKVAKLIQGKKIIVLGNTSGHGFKTGSTVLVNNSSKRTDANGCKSVTVNGSWMYTSEIELMETSIEELENSLKDLQIQQAEVESKIAYLKKTGQSNFDETEFKIWNTLQTLKTKKSDVEKAKIIAKLISQ